MPAEARRLRQRKDRDRGPLGHAAPILRCYSMMRMTCKLGGDEAARRLEAQLVFAQKKQTGARLAAEPYRPRLEPTPLVGVHKYRRPRFTYARA